MREEDEVLLILDVADAFEVEFEEDEDEEVDEVEEEEEEDELKLVSMRKFLIIRAAFDTTSPMPWNFTPASSVYVTRTVSSSTHSTSSTVKRPWVAARGERSVMLSARYDSTLLRRDVSAVQAPTKTVLINKTARRVCTGNFIEKGERINRFRLYDEKTQKL